MLIDYRISLPFKNLLSIFKIRRPFNLVNMTACCSGPVPCGYNFSSCLLFWLLLLLKFLRAMSPLLLPLLLPLPRLLPLPPPLLILHLPPPHPPLPEMFIFIFSPINSNIYWVKLCYISYWFLSFLLRRLRIFSHVDFVFHVLSILYLISCQLCEFSWLVFCLCWTTDYTVLIGRFRLPTAFRSHHKKLSCI